MPRYPFVILAILLLVITIVPPLAAAIIDMQKRGAKTKKSS